MKLIYLTILPTLLINIVFAETINALPRLNIGAVHYPPYYNFDGSEAKGLLVKHIEESLKKHYKLVWHHLPLVRGEKSLQSGDIDIFGSYAPGPGDKAQVSYSPIPLVKMQPIICTLKDDLNKITNEHIMQKEVVYPQGAYIHPLVKKLKLKINRVDYHGNYIDRALKMTKKQRVDYFILPESLSIREYKMKEPKLFCSSFAGPIAMHLSFKTDSKFIKEVYPLVKEFIIEDLKF